MKKNLILMLMLIATPAFAYDTLGSGLPGYSSAPLGSSGAYGNSYTSNSRRESQYNYNNSYTNTQSSSTHVPYGVYSNYGSMSAAEQARNNQILKRQYK